jgi:hypothetical protein
VRKRANGRIDGYVVDERVWRDEWERYEERDEYGDDVEFDYDGGAFGADGTFFSSSINPFPFPDHASP